MKWKNIALLLIITTIVFSCQSGNKGNEIPKITFDIPYLITLQKDDLIKELGEPQYTRTAKELATKTKFGDILIPSKTETSIYLKNGYRLELTFMPEKLNHTIVAYISNQDAQNVDSVGLQKIMIAGKINDESKLPSLLTLIKKSNGVAIHNFDKNTFKH